MDLEKLKQALKNEPAFRLRQCQRAVFCNFIESWDEATVFPKNLREKLSQYVPLSINANFFKSANGITIKALLSFRDQTRIETVLMRHNDGRNTVCVSCQAGCPMNCDFCATGKLGFKRNLTVDEIIDQVLVFGRYLKKEKRKVTNIVFMGMGEPMLNFENVIEAIKILNDKNSFNIGARKISISTCGIVDGIKKFSQIPLQLNLAISLHAPNDAVRNKIMPVNKSDNIDKLMSALKNYIQKTNRKIMIEYLLLKDVNDSIPQAIELARLLKRKLGRLFMVNLILYNETGKYKSPSKKAVFAFKATLKKEGIEVSQRYRFGHDIAGACGQLTANLQF